MSFLSPWFLLGALALIVPILIHLRRREPQSRIPFASVLLLRHVSEPVRGAPRHPQIARGSHEQRRRLHYWILFLVRSLAVLLLVLAFARPYWRGHSGGGHSETAIVLLVDTSFSMRYGARFSRAQEKAEEVLARAPEGARVGVVGFSTAVHVRAPLSPDREKARAAVRALRPTFRATDYALGIRAALSLFERSDQEALIYLISDFQRSEWRTEAFDLRLPQGVRLVPVPVASEGGGNRAILDVRALSRVVHPRYPERLSVRVGNFRDARTRTTVRLFVNDRLVQEQAVALEPEAIATVGFTDFPLDPGFNRIRVELDPDELPEDDRFVLVIRREAPKPILVLEGSRARSGYPPVGGPAERASFYVQNALLADEAFEPDRVLVRSFAEARPEEIAGAEALLLVDPPSLDPTWNTALREFVHRGGGLILALGSQTDVRAFNAGLGPWLGVRIEGGYSETPSLLTAIETDHPIFRPFADPRRANFSRARFYGYMRLALESAGGVSQRGSPGGAASVLARFHDGGPALVEVARGRGRVLVLAFGLDARRSTLPLTPLYAPLIHQMLVSVTGAAWSPHALSGSRGMSPPPAFRVGEIVVLERTEGAPHATGALTVGYPARSRGDPGPPHAISRSHGDPVSERLGIVYAPDGERLPIGRPPSDEGLSGESLRFTPEQVGFYRVRRMSGDEPIAVNVEAGESDVRPMGEAELARRLAVLGEGAASDVPASKQGSTLLSADNERALTGSPRDLQVAGDTQTAWRMLLVAALLLLLSEVVLAERVRWESRVETWLTGMFFGHPTRLPEVPRRGGLGRVGRRRRMGASSPQEVER